MFSRLLSQYNLNLTKFQGYDVGLIDYNCDLVLQTQEKSEGREFDSRSVRFVPSACRDIKANSLFRDRTLALKHGFSRFFLVLRKS